MLYPYSIASCAGQIRREDSEAWTGQQEIISGRIKDEDRGKMTGRKENEDWKKTDGRKENEDWKKMVGPKENNGRTDSFVVQNRKLFEDFTALLIVYDKAGTERSVSFYHKCEAAIQMPHQGWYHKHEFIEIFYVIEGSFSQILFGERRTFEAGEFMIADQNCEHADYIEAKDAAVLFLQIRSEYLDMLLRSYDGKNELQQFLFHSLRRQKREQSFLRLRRSGKVSVLQKAQQPEREVKEKLPGSEEKEQPSEDEANTQLSGRGEKEQPYMDEEMDMLLGNLFYEDMHREPGYEDIRKGLLIRILQRFCTEYTPRLHTTSQEGKEKELLYEVERYIRLYAATVTTADLEEVFHYHRNYYNLLLKKYRELSFREYVLQVRLSYARQLLEQTELPVSQVARQVGYENTSHFYHLFRKMYGVGPREVHETNHTAEKEWK